MGIDDAVFESRAEKHVLDGISSFFNNIEIDKDNIDYDKSEKELIYEPYSIAYHMLYPIYWTNFTGANPDALNDDQLLRLRTQVRKVIMEYIS